MGMIDTSSWHGRLIVCFYAGFDQKPPRQCDPWRYVATLLGAALYLGCSLLFCIPLNIGTIPFGVFVEPVWLPRARFRRLTFPGGIPIISVALPFWLAIATWHTWRTRGLAEAIGPFVFTAVLAFALLACFVLFNRLRRYSGDGNTD